MKKNHNEEYKLYHRQPIVYILVGIGIMLIILYLSLLEGKKIVAEKLLDKKMDLVELKMSEFFSSVEKTFIIFYKGCKTGVYHGRDLEELNKIFMPVIDGLDAISSVDVADEKGNCYLLDKFEDVYVNMITVEGSKTIKPERYEWLNNNGELNLVCKNKLDVLYDPRLRPWYRGALETNEDAVFWTKPYHFYPSNMQGITISKKWTDERDKEHIISFDISILDISKFTSQMQISTNGKAFVLTEDNCFVGLPKDERFREQKNLLDNLLIDIDSLGTPVISAAQREIVKYRKQKQLYTFHFNGERYFLEVKPFVLGDNIFRICLLIPEKDLTNTIQKIGWIVVLSIFIILLMIILMVKAYRSIRNVNQSLSHQKHELEIKSKKVHDSILYAKHLQEAILPSDTMIKQLFRQSFILYKPKDIVSGDFYWTHSFDKMIYFAVADCTGHGVPGAMVSVVCTIALNRVIRDCGVVEPGKILDNVRDQVVDVFNQRDKGVSDGMDIALCCMDIEMNKLWYSGANNSLYRVSRKSLNDCPMQKKTIFNTDRFLCEYPAMRQPIGKFIQVRSFQTHELKLEKGDCIYLSTDGFADQFGGPRGKKYKSKSFKNFLLSISEEPMDKQKELLTNELEIWKGSLEQIDDICILGIRI